jgi:hypothetical protein
MDGDLVIPEDINWDDELENLDTDGILLEHEAHTQYNEACAVADSWGSVRIGECLGLRIAASDDDEEDEDTPAAKPVSLGSDEDTWGDYPKDACIGTIFFAETIEAICAHLGIDTETITEESGNAAMMVLHNVLVQGVTVGLQSAKEAQIVSLLLPSDHPEDKE